MVRALHAMSSENQADLPLCAAHFLNKRDDPDYQMSFMDQNVFELCTALLLNKWKKSPYPMSLKDQVAFESRANHFLSKCNDLQNVQLYSHQITPPPQLPLSPTSHPRLNIDPSHLVLLRDLVTQYTMHTNFRDYYSNDQIDNESLKIETKKIEQNLKDIKILRTQLPPEIQQPNRNHQSKIWWANQTASLQRKNQLIDNQSPLTDIQQPVSDNQQMINDSRQILKENAAYAKEQHNEYLYKELQKLPPILSKLTRSQQRSRQKRLQAYPDSKEKRW